MKYLFFDVEKFLEDEDFIKWVKHPSPERDFFWNSFLREFPEKRVAVVEAKVIIEAFGENKDTMPQDEVANIRRHLIDNVNQLKFVEEKEGKFPYTGVPNFLKIAAVIIFLMVSSVALFILKKNSKTEDGPVFTEQVSNYGQRSSIILPDGSKVWLNGGSKLRYRKGLEINGLREVFLEGEGFFEVAKNKKKPFIVNANGLKIKVLGTKFNVKSYNQDATVETTLVEGSVSINDQKENVILKPSEKAIYSKASDGLELLKVDPLADYAWKDGMLIVEDESFEKAVEKLERWYGVDIVLDGGKDCKLKFKITSESLDDVLENIKIASRISYRRADGKILIDARNCN